MNIPQVTLWITIMQGWSMSDMLMIGCAELSVRKKDCKKIKEDFKNFLKEQLQLELSEEKTLITNAQKSAKFLSYEIRVRHSNLTKRDKTGKLVRNYTAELYWKFQVIQSGNT